MTDQDTGEPVACRMHLKNASGRAQRAGDPFRNPFDIPEHLVIPKPQHAKVMRFQPGRAGGENPARPAFEQEIATSFRRYKNTLFSE